MSKTLREQIEDSVTLFLDLLAKNGGEGGLSLRVDGDNLSAAEIIIGHDETISGRSYATTFPNSS